MNRRNLLIALLPMLLSGCNGQGVALESAADVGKANPAKQKGGYRKPGADVMLVNQGVPRLIPGQVKQLELMLRTGHQEGVMQVSVSPTEGLQIINGSDTFEYQLARGQVYKLPLQLFTETPGRYYLNLTVNVQVASGASIARALSFVVQAGEGKAAISDREEVSEKVGEESGGVISMPAQEVVY